MPDQRKRQLVLLGRPCVGKSTLTVMFVDKKFEDCYYPTIAKNYNVEIKDYDLTICDTAGLDEQSQISTRYLESDGFILVYSVTDMQRFFLLTALIFFIFIIRFFN